MSMIKKALLVMTLCITFVNAKTLPVESSLITGELENGMKYTIKKNKKPDERATLRLLVKVGSLEEDDDQKGVAHLVEHMAFNGTKHFKGNDIIKFLESIGVAFGSHLNASTSATETIYKLDIPLKDDNLEKSMLIFSDWAGAINFTKKELDKERGVIQEEARSRNSAGFRLYLQVKEVAYANSKYKDRTPIGDMDIIKNISVKRVKDFYDDWYRPELMHFVVAGDIDVKKTQELIEKSFSHLKSKSTRKRASREVPKVDKTRVLILKDKELTASSVDVSYFDEYKAIKTHADYKEALTKSIMLKLFNEKASEQLIKKNPAAKRIRMLSKKFASNLRTYSFSAHYTGLKEIAALKEMTNLMFSIEKYGFNEKDFKRAIKELKKGNQEALKSIESKTSQRYADQIVRLAVYDDIFVDEKYRIKLTNKLLDEIKLDEVYKMYKKIFTLKSKMITYTISDDNVEVSKRKVKQILKDAKKHVKKQDTNSNLPDRINIGDLKASKITKEVYNKKYDFYEFTLENGVKIAYKFNDYAKNKVSLKAFSKGGYSLYETKDLTNAQYATKIISSSGFDKFNILDVSKIYSDKNISVKPNIGRYGESINGSSITKDFEFLLEGVYLYAKKYRFDENVFANQKQITISGLKKENKVPMSKYNREFMDFYYNKNKRFAQTSIEDIQTLDKNKMLEIYKDRFSDFNNFTFIIVGDISKEDVKKYSSLYLGNLPTSNREETFNFRNIKHVQGQHKFARNYNNENISEVSLSYTKEMPYSLEENIKLTALKDVLNTKLRELIREEKSGVYGVRVGSQLSRIPYEKASINISFTCDPARKDELIKYVKQTLEDVKTNLVHKKYVQAFVKKRKLAYKQAIKTASFWSGQLRTHYYHGDSMDRIETYPKVYKSITPIIIKETANKYLDTMNIIYTELNPKNLKK